MTTDIERQFFDTFGIKPTVYTTYCEKATPVKNVERIEIYPQITDRILLELIRVFAGAFGSFEIYRCKNFEHLKHIILAEMIAEHTGIKHRVQSLFKEG